jgi:DNA repair protein RecO (recombination protein O)
MEERATGIVLRTHPVTETSLIVRWLTREAGRIDTIAKGARGRQSPFRGKLDLFYLAELSYRRSQRSQLHVLREVVLREPHATLRTDLVTLRQASYASALITQTTESDTPMPEVYELMAGLLGRLVQSGPEPLLLVTFELKLLHILGQQPAVSHTDLTQGAQRICELCASAGWDLLDRLKPSAAQVGELGRFIDRYLVEQLGRVPKEREKAIGISSCELRVSSEK